MARERFSSEESSFFGVEGFVNRLKNTQGDEIENLPGYIDMGADSFVFKNGKKVFKFFRKDKVSFDNAYLYKEVTNGAVEIFKKEKHKIKLGENLAVRVKANPIDDIIFSNGLSENPDVSGLVAVCPYIKGIQLSNLDDGIYGNGLCGYSVSESLQNLENVLEKNLGVRGIFLISRNVKLNRRGAMITDVSFNLGELKKI